jgi:formiminotetrahydrofolate cyclodeaminase
VAESADATFEELLERVASAAPIPGAGPSAAWTLALAAALVEMVGAVALAKEPDDPGAVAGRRERAAALRAHALSLATRDAAAYQDVLAVTRSRGEAGYTGRLRAALSAAVDPLVAIAEAAAELTRLAADAAADARGGVRGEAIAAAVLAEAVARAVVPLVQLNLAGQPEDPRFDQVRELADGAQRDRDRAVP